MSEHDRRNIRHLPQYTDFGGTARTRINHIDPISLQQLKDRLAAAQEAPRAEPRSLLDVLLAWSRNIYERPGCYFSKTVFSFVGIPILALMTLISVIYHALFNLFIGTRVMRRKLNETADTIDQMAVFMSTAFDVDPGKVSGDLNKDFGEHRDATVKHGDIAPKIVAGD